MKTCAALVVEDDETVQRLTQVILQKYCSSVDVAGDGQQAIDMLHSGAYGLVILDLMLPKVNGLAVLEAIRALPDPPKVIVLSAISRYFADRLPPDTIVLQKPFEIDRLEELIGSLT